MRATCTRFSRAAPQEGVGTGAAGGKPRGSAPPTGRPPAAGAKPGRGDSLQGGVFLQERNNCAYGAAINLMLPLPGLLALIESAPPPAARQEPPGRAAAVALVNEMRSALRRHSR